MYFNQIEFGQRVKALRKENGYTLQQMADELNVSYEVLDSVLRFIEIYDEEIDPDRLIFQLCQVDPIRIWEEGKKAGTRFSGYRRYLYQIYKQYIGINPEYYLPKKF